MYCGRCGTWTPDAERACARCGESLAAARVPGDGAGAAAASAAGTVTATFASLAEPRYAGFWRRFLASLVDATVLYFPDAILRAAFGLPTFYGLRAVRDEDVAGTMAWLALSITMRWIYGAALESSPQQGTLGQQLLALRVCDSNLRRVSFGRATARHVGALLSWLLCGGGFLFNLWTARRQTLHDMVAGCVIVRPGAASQRAASPPVPGAVS